MGDRIAPRMRALAVVCLISVLAAACALPTSSGHNVGPGVSGKTITLGVIAPLSGPLAASTGVPLTRGLETYFRGVDDTGGIDGYKVQLVEKDSGYDPITQVQAYGQIHDQVAMIAASFGVPTTQAIQDLAAQDHLLVAATDPVSGLARQTYFVLVGTPYRLQVENAFDYVVNKVGASGPTTGLVVENDGYGADIAQGYKEAVKCYHLGDAGQFAVGPADTNFGDLVSRLQAAGAKYVVLASDEVTNGQIIEAADKAGYDPQWILQSDQFLPVLLTDPTLASLMQKHAWVVGPGAATWGDTSQPGMARMLDDLGRYAPGQPPDAQFELGYTQAWVAAAILKRAADQGDLTRDGLLKAFNSLTEVDLGGLQPPASYGASPDRRVPERDSRIFAVDRSKPLGLNGLSPVFTGSCAESSQF